MTSALQRTSERQIFDAAKLSRGVTATVSSTIAPLGPGLRSFVDCKSLKNGHLWRLMGDSRDGAQLFGSRMVENWKVARAFRVQHATSDWRAGGRGREKCALEEAQRVTGPRDNAAKPQSTDNRQRAQRNL